MQRANTLAANRGAVDRPDRARSQTVGGESSSSGRSGGRSRTRSRRSRTATDEPRVEPLFAPSVTVRPLAPHELVASIPRSLIPANFITPHGFPAIPARPAMPPSTYVPPTLANYGFPTLAAHLSTPPPAPPHRPPAPSTLSSRSSPPVAMRAAFVPYAGGPTTPPPIASCKSTFALMQRRSSNLATSSSGSLAVTSLPDVKTTPASSRRTSVDSYGSRSRQPSYSRRGSVQLDAADQENGMAAWASAQAGRGAAATSWR